MAAITEGTYITLSERRRIILEKLLQKRKGYTKEELLAKLSRELSDFREGDELSLRSLNYDLKYLINQGAEIEKIKFKTQNDNGRQITSYRYRYAHAGWSFLKQSPDQEALISMRVAASILKQIPGFDLDQSLKKIHESLSSISEYQRPERICVLFDYREGIEGVKHIPYLLKSIMHQQVVQISYKPFTSEKPFTDCVSPYLLKEYESRWYLIGHSSSRNEMRHYGLDRIVGGSITHASGVDFFHTSNFDPMAYFSSVIGITLSKNDQVQRMVFKFRKPRAQYVAYAPLHHSQELISEDEYSATYAYRLVINHELQNLLLSYGKDLEVLEPAMLRENIANILKEALSSY